MVDDDADDLLLQVKVSFQLGLNMYFPGFDMLYLNNDRAIPPSKKCTMSDLREYAIAAYFRIFFPHILRLHGPHILKKIPAFFRHL